MFSQKKSQHGEWMWKIICVRSHGTTEELQTLRWHRSQNVIWIWSTAWRREKKLQCNKVTETKKNLIVIKTFYECRNHWFFIVNVLNTFQLQLQKHIKKIFLTLVLLLTNINLHIIFITGRFNILISACQNCCGKQKAKEIILIWKKYVICLHLFHQDKPLMLIFQFGHNLKARQGNSIPLHVY